MARCFPFPPPGFAGKCLSDEALIVSIKLQRENEKANPDRKVESKSKSSDKEKERKREKKEKKREKKEKKRQKKEKKRQEEGSAKFSVDGEKQILAEKLLQADKHKVASKHKGSIRGRESELVLNKSNVTEEHGRPTDLQNVSCSSDSTGNSSKRKRPSTPPGCSQSNGGIIRIRLSSTQNIDEPSTSGRKEDEISIPPRKIDDPSTSSYSKIRPCSNLSRRTLSASMKQNDAIVESPKNITNFASTSNAATTSQLASRQDKEVVPCLAKRIESTPSREKLLSHMKRPCSNLEREGSTKKHKDAIIKSSTSNAVTIFQPTVSRKDKEVVPCLAKKIESAPLREKLSSMKQKDAIINNPQNITNLASTSKEVVPCLAKKIESAPPREKLSSMKHNNITNVTSTSIATTKEVVPCLAKKIESAPPREKLSSMKPQNITNVTSTSNATTTTEVVPCLAKKMESAPPREKLSSTKHQNITNLTSNATTKEVVPCLATKIESAPPREKLSFMKHQNVTNLTSTSNATTKEVVPCLAKIDATTKDVVPCLAKIESAPPREKLSSHEKRVLKRQSHYKKLLDSWIPPTVQSELVVVNNGTDDDEDWLFGRRKNEENLAKRSKLGDLEKSEGSFPRCASSAIQPRAMFLSDAQVYALPFTVPF